MGPLSEGAAEADAAVARQVGADRPAAELVIRWQSLPTTRRRLEPGLEKLDVLLRALEHLVTRTHVGTSQFISRLIQVTKFKLTLAKPQMEKRISNRLWAVHGHREIIPARNKIAS